MNSSNLSTDSGTGGAAGAEGVGGDTVGAAGAERAAGAAGSTRVWEPLRGMVDEAISSRRRVAASSLRRYLAMCFDN